MKAIQIIFGLLAGVVSMTMFVGITFNTWGWAGIAMIFAIFLSSIISGVAKELT